VNWKKAALRLARAIIRFEKNDYQRVHTQSTTDFAYKIVRKSKKRIGGK
jgi:hypothetical protein